MIASFKTLAILLSFWASEALFAKTESGGGGSPASNAHFYLLQKELISSSSLSPENERSDEKEQGTETY